jgi:hypothetical protein
MNDVPASHPLLRLPKPPRDFVADQYQPSAMDFEPSSEEKRQMPVRVSVWDACLTRAEEAAGFRSAGRLLVLRADAVAAVLAVDDSLRVVYDPLTDSALAARPGANGHAGIEGLVRRPKEDRPQQKLRLSRVADVFRLEREIAP